MSNNVSITQGSGTQVATDQVTGTLEHVQLFKVAVDTAGSRTPVPASAANGLTVDVTRVQGTVSNVQSGVWNVNVSTANPGYFRVLDGTTTTVATVGNFHNTDNLTGGGGGSLLTGGVAQLQNATGTQDRQRATGLDNIPALGVATGTAQMASPIGNPVPTVTGAITSGGSPQTVTVSATTGTTLRGGPWAIVPGTLLTVFKNGDGANTLETVYVTAVPSTTSITAIFSKNHSAGAALNGFVYNQARDATIPDGAVGTGLAANATYLFNGTLNAAVGGWEAGRSAAGELDGATGAGTNIAAGYEWNAGGPLNNTNVISSLQFDRERNLQGKGAGSGTITNNPLAAGSTTLTLTSAPTTLLPGMQIILDRAGANPEANYVSTTYTAGSTSVALQNATAFSHALNSTVEWDQFAGLGPQLNGFTGAGIGIEEDVIFNPVDNKYYIERSATADAMAGANLVAFGLGLYNGATFDRARNVLPADATAIPTATLGVNTWHQLYNGTTYDRQRGNIDTGALITAAGATTTQTTADQVNYNGRGVIVVLDMTTVGTGSVTLEIDAKDTASGKYVALLTGAAVTTNSTNIYTVYPGNTVAANVSASTVLPRTWRIKVTANNANATTYTVGASVIL